MKGSDFLIIAMLAHIVSGNLKIFFFSLVNKVFINSPH